MFTMKTATTALVLAFAGATQAHMIMQSPTPITNNDIKDPIESSGANFPCHGQPLSPSGGVSWSVGSTQNLSFQLGGGANTAVHGGGSCQVSVTYETDAEKVKDPSNWYVIHSIEGGCPSITEGNLNSATECGSIGQPDCVNSFPFEIPKELKNGQATMAWTWSNTIGNREYYMDCAYVDVTGGSDELGDLPNLYVGNLDGIQGSCTNAESTQVKYPQPGKYVTTPMPQKYPLAAPNCPSGSDATQAPAGGSGSSGSSGSGSSGSGSSSGASSSAPASAPSSSAPGVFAPTGAPAGTGSAPSPTSVPVASTPAAQPSSAPAAPAPAPPSSGSGSSSGNGTSGDCPSGSQSCSTPGQVVCSGSQFGLCNINNCAVLQDLAAGTQCTDNKVARMVRRGLGTHIL
ncbi:MAG: hypothetical protein M1821_005774 [Bathelium mastoideum]|nr:MAG: hypothetical protein M1821_005774 [Bathelium mastoideum]KAI9681702.1 MAG: hypothetical protein M1822_007054 [Bathelium mastoideum]